jgi:hypothetical protein
MTTKKRRQNRLPPFVPVTKALLASRAWLAMTYGARLAYIDLRSCLRNDYLNNGKFYRSCRKAAKALGTGSARRVSQWYAELEHYGFVRRTGEGFLGADGRGVAARYRLTECPCDGKEATRDFEKWDGELFVYIPRRPGRKKQNPVAKRDTPRSQKGHIREGSGRSPVCSQKGHIELSPGCSQKGHTSRRTSPQRRGRMKQGSSMARAPVQAGDAGSSPAPVIKKPWSTPQVEELPP